MNLLKRQHNPGAQRWQWWRWRTLALGLVIGLSLGCAKSSPPPLADSFHVVLVPPARTNEATGAFLALAREAFPQAELYPAPARLTLAHRRWVLVVLQPALLEPHQWPALAQSLDAGTPVLFWGCDPLQGLPQGTANLPMISPASWRWSSPAARLRVTGDEAWVPFPFSVQSAWAGFRGAGRAPENAGRWIPLAETEDLSGQGKAWPAALYVQRRTNGTVCTWGWIGLDRPPGQDPLLVRLLRRGVERLQAGCFFLQGGSDRLAQEGGGLLEMGAQIHAPTGEISSLRVVAELTESGGKSTRRVSASGQPQLTLNLGALPRLTDRFRDYVLRLSLWSADGTVRLDQLEQPLRVLPLQTPAAAERIGVTGAGFTLGRRPTYLFGVPFQLRTVRPRAEGEPEPNPLDPAVFEVDSARREIALAQAAGFNVLSLTLDQEDQIPPLRWLMEELRPRSLWIHLRVAGLEPLEPDWPRARRLLEQARVLEDPLVCALEIGWTGPLGREEQRRALDDDWRAWLAREQAEDLIPWRREGRPTGPPDPHLAHDGEHRPAVALYRRFVDEWTSLRYGQIRRFLQGLGLRALVSARAGWGGPPDRFPVDPSSGATHLDFLTLDAAGLESDDWSRAHAAFCTVYARGRGLGKPVLWRNLGLGSGATEDAATRIQSLLDMALRSHAAGVMVTPIPGGARPGAVGPDEGFTGPDGRWRPSGEVLRRFTIRIRREASAPLAWGGQFADRDQDARGLYGLLQSAGSSYGDRATGGLPELRPPGYGSSSMDLAATGLVLQAEWGALRAEGQPVESAGHDPVGVPVRAALELEVWNTGPVRWAGEGGRRPGSVTVEARHATARAQTLPVPDTPPGQRALIRWTPADPGRWTLRAQQAGPGPFGEPLTIAVTLPEPAPPPATAPDVFPQR